MTIEINIESVRKYKNELITINQYQAEIKEHLQESANEMTRVTTLYNKITDLNLQNAKNTSNLDYQNKTKPADIDLQNKMQTYKAELDTYVQKIARFSAEITAYSADVTREVQEHTANFQNDTTDYTWMQGQLLKLQAQYDAAFGAVAAE